MAESSASALAGREPPVPSWDGSEPSVLFAIYEKNVRLWEFESEVPEKKRGARLLRGLSGVARAAADSLEFEQLTGKDGVRHILDCLRSHFAPHLEAAQSLREGNLWCSSQSQGVPAGVLDTLRTSVLHAEEGGCQHG